MKSWYPTLALIFPLWAVAAPAVYGPVTVSGNKAAVAVTVSVQNNTSGQFFSGTQEGAPLLKDLPCQGKVCSAVKALPGPPKGSLIDLRHANTPESALNVNSVKLRGSPNVGGLNVINNDADLILTIGGQANVNSISVGR
jgi:hypothetical protein